ncbi:MAG: ABC transporter permease subunit [Proteobacteria bacterium]|nr:ABC transporter permease subunit [Pseudomonadota bacterium]
MLPHGIAVLWHERALMLDGLLATIGIAAASAVLASLLGLVLFGLMIGRARRLPAIVAGFVDLMRCVPFMLFCYLIYYGLPRFGLVLGNVQAGILALTLYNAAYIAELLRGAYKALPAETTEAGLAFGFHGWRLLVRVILPPVVLSAVPMLGNQMVQIIKDSAFLVIIAVQELTYAANEIQANYYVPFASFICAMLLYWGLCLGVEGGVRAVLRAAEARR